MAKLLNRIIIGLLVIVLIIMALSLFNVITNKYVIAGAHFANVLLLIVVLAFPSLRRNKAK